MSKLDTLNTTKKKIYYKEYHVNLAGRAKLRPISCPNRGTIQINIQ